MIRYLAPIDLVVDHHSPLIRSGSMMSGGRHIVIAPIQDMTQHKISPWALYKAFEPRLDQHSLVFGIFGLLNTEELFPAVGPSRPDRAVGILRNGKH